MLDYEIVYASALQRVIQILNKLMGYGCVNRIHQSNLLIHNQIRIIGYASGYRKQVLKKSKPSVVAPYPPNVFSYLSCTLHVSIILLSYNIVPKFVYHILSCSRLLSRRRSSIIT